MSANETIPNLLAMCKKFKIVGPNKIRSMGVSLTLFFYIFEPIVVCFPRKLEKFKQTTYTKLTISVVDQICV